MAKNFKSGGVDFDDIFEADAAGDGPPASFLTSGGVALKYAAIAYGTKAPDVGYRNSAGQDVSNLWAAKGSVPVGTIPNPPDFDDAVWLAEDADSSIAHAIFTFTMNANGSWSSETDSDSGEWFVPATAGVGNPYQVRFTTTHLSGSVGDITNSASGWTSLSAGRMIRIEIEQAGSGSNSSSYSVLVEIRRASNSVVVASGTFTANLLAEIAGS